MTTRYLVGDNVDQLLARETSRGVGWYLTDNLGSVRDIVTNSGKVLDQITYDPFGNITAETNPANGDRFKFTGREFDATTHLSYNRARYYDPTTGTWTGQDPLGFDAGDGNLYRYVVNGPTSDTDPSGEQPLPATTAPNAMLRPGDLVIITESSPVVEQEKLNPGRKTATPTKKDYEKMAATVGFTVAQGTPDSIASLTKTIEKEAGDKGKRFNRVIIISHAGGDHLEIQQNGPSVKLSKGDGSKEEFLIADTLQQEKPLQNAIQGALNPNGCLVMQVCGYHDDKLLIDEKTGNVVTDPNTMLAKYDHQDPEVAKKIEDNVRKMATTLGFSVYACSRDAHPYAKEWGSETELRTRSQSQGGRLLDRGISLIGADAKGNLDKSYLLP